MKQFNPRSSFRYRRVAGSHHHTYRVDIRGLAYRISLRGRLVRGGAAGMLSEDADINAVIKAFAINDIENLVGMDDPVAKWRNLGSARFRADACAHAVSPAGSEPPFASSVLCPRCPRRAKRHETRACGATGGGSIT